MPEYQIKCSSAGLISIETDIYISVVYFDKVVILAEFQLQTI